MKPFHLILLFFLSASGIISCSNKKADNKQQEVQTQNQHKIVVNYVGLLRARRSYASIQFMLGEKEIEKYLKKHSDDNPEVEFEFDSTSKYLAQQFEKLGLIKNGELLLKNFKKQTKEKTIYSDSSGREIGLVFYHNLVTDHCHFKLLSAADSVEIDTGGTNLQDLDYAFLDVIPGSNKELVFLDDYHISNGDNFDFMIYEIKIN